MPHAESIKDDFLIRFEFHRARRQGAEGVSQTAQGLDLVGQGLELFEPRHRHAPESGGFNDVSQHFVLEPGLDVEVAVFQGEEDLVRAGQFQFGTGVDDGGLAFLGVDEQQEPVEGFGGRCG